MKSLSEIKNKKILLKISGEDLNLLSNENNSSYIIKLIEELQKKDVKISIVLGGGNILRGRSENTNIGRLKKDNIGMLATVINGIAFASTLQSKNIKNIHSSFFDITGIAKRECDERINRKLLKGYVVILTGGTGNPYFSTDTTSVIQAKKMNCDYIIKITKTNGIYNKDPNLNENAELIERTTYQELLKMNCNIFDKTAAAFAIDSGIKTLFIKSGTYIEDILNNDKKFSLVE